MTSDPKIEFGGSASAIRHHYDVGNRFYAAWLDPSLAYSCAMWDGLSDDAPLEEAQRRKHQFHAQSIGASQGMRVLDVGCGWGAMMQVLKNDFQVTECVGLTMSEEQHAHLQGLQVPDISVVLTNWRDFEPEQSFDGIISIGAFEHFAHPAQSVEERREVYREFFKSCREWTRGKGRLSLQTIAYGKMTPDQANPFISNEIFPDAELPTLQDIVAASAGIYRVERLRDDGLEYAKTCEIWSRNLRRAVKEGRINPEKDPCEKYSHYLRLSAAGFRMRKITLLRMAFEPE